MQGDFGLAIKFDEEIPFSRSGTLDYMAPEVRGALQRTCPTAYRLWFVYVL